MGNITPSVDGAEHIGPQQTGDNIEAKRVAGYIWNQDTSQWVRPVAMPLSTQVAGTDVGVVAHAVIHGKTTAGDGSFVDVKVNPSGSLVIPDGASTEEYQTIQTDVLNEIRSAVQAIAYARGIAADLRVTLLGGTTAVTGTLTAVTTVTGLTNIGGIPAVTLVQSNQNVAAVLSNINNVAI